MITPSPESGNTPPPPAGEHDPAIRAAAVAVNAAHQELRQARQMLFQSLRARAATGRRETGHHGTPAGYRRHQREGSVPCDACVEAWSWSKMAARRAGAA